MLHDCDSTNAATRVAARAAAQAAAPYATERDPLHTLHRRSKPPISDAEYKAGERYRDLVESVFGRYEVGNAHHGRLYTGGAPTAKHMRTTAPIKLFHDATPGHIDRKRQLDTIEGELDPMRDFVRTVLLEGESVVSAGKAHGMGRDKSSRKIREALATMAATFESLDRPT